MRKTTGMFFFIALMATVLITSSNFAVATQHPSPTGTSETQNLLDQPYADDFSTNSGVWTLLGSAYRDPENQYLVLTEPTWDEGGVAFFKVPFTNAFTANFSYKVGGGSGGDGFTMFFYKQEYSAIGKGGSLGFSNDTEAVLGYGVEFDGWQNLAQGEPSPPKEAGDPSGNHIALIKDWYGNHLVYVNDSKTEDNTWHNVSVVVGDAYVGVFVDGEFVLRWDGTLDRTFDGFGFSGGTGSATNGHIIDNFFLTTSVTEPPLTSTRQNAVNATRASSFLSIAADASSSEVGSTVNINGRISDEDGTPLGEGKTVILSYAVGNNASWFPLGSGETNTLGEYNIQWVPWASGTFTLKTEWSGDLNYTGTFNTTTLCFLPYQNQKVLCVESNSTVTGLEFNDANLTLGFTVSGPTGTTGYTKVAIAKSLASDINGITTSVDGKAVNFTAASSAENWIIALTYPHSTHQVSIDLLAQEKEALNPTTVDPELPTLLAAGAITISAAITVAAAIIMKRKRA